MPHLLSPRNTALLNGNSLVIRWAASPGASRYVVSIEGRGIDWRVETDQTELVYKREALFKPDYRYRIKVTADNGKQAEAGMTVLPEVEVQRVVAEVEQIRGLGLEPDMEAVGMALTYQNYEHHDPERRSYALNDAALAVLARRVEADTENSQIYLLQGNAYLDIGLPLLAQVSFEEALALAEAAGQQEWQAESLWGLGAVAEGQTEYEDALHYFTAAAEVYAQLSDLETVEKLQARIARLREEQ